MSGSGIDPATGEWTAAFATQRPPFERGNTAALRHGARSQHAIGRRSAYEKQRCLKRLGLRQSDIDPWGRTRLDKWALVAAEVHLYRAWLDEHGLVDEDGRPAGFMATFYAACNSEARRWRELEPYLRAAVERKEGRGRDALHRHLETNYGNGGGR